MPLSDTDLAMLGGRLADMLLERRLLHDPRLPGGGGGDQAAGDSQPQSLDDLLGYLGDLGRHWYTGERGLLACWGNWATWAATAATRVSEDYPCPGRLWLLGFRV